MGLDKIIFFFLFTIFNFFSIKYYKFFFLKKIIDKDFNKPQAFHTHPAIRTGGISILFFLILFSIFIKNWAYNNYFLAAVILSIIFFIVGFLEDIRISSTPLVRLFFLVFLSFFVLFYFDIHVFKTQVQFINNIIYTNKFLSIIFVCLCLMFIVNGCNFIDGFNGLLIIHSLIIFTILYFVNIFNDSNLNIENFLLFFILILISLLLFNFPRAKIFLGDSGAYIIGIILAITTIEISNLNPKIPPFFFANLLFYVFFEVIFSFFRKIVVENKSPFVPDKKHLHMLIFKFLKKKVKNSLKANFLTSLIINIIYFIAIIPNLFYYKDEFFCKTYFFLLISFYSFFYFYLEKK
jgi:UDP-N-acetylmuramyl pentapeptide phosphotransferase/UDP-N-acetylglucosamine-1-phosphate transferase